LAEKATTIKKSGEGVQVKVIQWRALGIRCGACFSTIPSGINLHRGVLFMTSYLPEIIRKEPSELMIHSKDYAPPSPCTSQNSKRSHTDKYSEEASMKTDDDILFVHVLLPGSSKYIHDVHHCWFSILAKEQRPVGIEQLKTADSMLALHLLIKRIS
jgi:hypothetical protein